MVKDDIAGIRRSVVARAYRLLGQWDAVTVSCASARALGRQVLVDIRGHCGNYSSEVHPIGWYRHVLSPTVMLCWHAWREHIGRRGLAEWHSLPSTCLEYTSRADNITLRLHSRLPHTDKMTYATTMKNADKRSLRKVRSYPIFHYFIWANILCYQEMRNV